MAEVGGRRHVLPRRGAMPTLPDDPPWATPKAWADRRGHQPIVRLLEERERSGALPPRRVERFHPPTHDLVDAYRGDPAALQRIVEYFRAERAFMWDPPSHDVQVLRLRKAVLDRLGDRRSAETADASPAPDDAQWLIARAEGFEQWEDLVADVDS